MNLKDAKAVYVPRRARKRRGIGRASGLGKQSGRGNKGYQARQGGGTRLGIREGGQMPLYRRLPKRGFNNIWRCVYAVVNVDTLNCFEDGATVGPEDLHRAGLLPKNIGDGLKVLGRGDLSRRLVVKAHRFSDSAKAKIAAAGGEAHVLVAGNHAGGGGRASIRRTAKAASSTVTDTSG